MIEPLVKKLRTKISKMRNSRIGESGNVNICLGTDDLERLLDEVATLQQRCEESEQRVAELERDKANLIQQAEQQAQEARTQRSIVLEIGGLVGCDKDYEMVPAVRDYIIAMEKRLAAQPAAVEPVALSDEQLNIVADYYCDMAMERGGDLVWLFTLDRFRKLVNGIRHSAPPAQPAPVEPVAWMGEDVHPTEKGWYAVMRADGSLCIRAYGNDHWWVPLGKKESDGWFSGLPAGFKWFGPLVDVMWDYRTPEAPPAQARPEWQPIETAPKDGSFILLCDSRWANAPIIIGKWHSAFKCWQGQSTPSGKYVLWEDASVWMPLPAAPTPPAQESGS